MCSTATVTKCCRFNGDRLSLGPANAGLAHVRGTLNKKLVILGARSNLVPNVKLPGLAVDCPFLAPVGLERGGVRRRAADPAGNLLGRDPDVRLIYHC